MKTLRQLGLAFVLTFTLSISAVAGEMLTPGFTGQVETPGITGNISTPGITGEISSPGIAGDILTPGFLSLLFSSMGM